MSAIVVAGRNDLLGARLRNILGAWRFAKQINAKFIINWRNYDENYRSPYSFYDLFDREAVRALDNVNVVEVELDGSISSVEGTIAPDVLGRALDPKAWTVVTSLNVANSQPTDISAQVIRYEVTGPMRFEGESMGDANADMADLFVGLPINKAVAAAIESAASTNSKIVVSHIRRGNLVEYLFGRDSQSLEALRSDIKNFVPRYAHLNAYRRVIDSRFPDSPLDFFSDDLQLRGAACAMYGSRVVDQNAALDAHPLTELQRAFAEFLLISRCEAIVSTNSAFAILPAILGRVPQFDARRHTLAEEVIDDLSHLVRASHRYTGTDKHMFFAEILQNFSELYADPKLADQSAEFATAADAARRGRQP